MTGCPLLAVTMLQPWQLLLSILAGWINEEQQKRIEYLRTESQVLKEKLGNVLQTLTERERKVLQLRFGLGDGYCRTLEEVGRQFRVTRERIRQIEAKALRKMRHPTRQRQIEGFLQAQQL